jgi:hypothetical protein
MASLKSRNRKESFNARCRERARDEIRMLKYLIGYGTCVKAVTVGERISVQIRHLVKKYGYTVPIDKFVIVKNGKLVSRFLCPCLAREA